MRSLKNKPLRTSEETISLNSHQSFYNYIKLFIVAEATDQKVNNILNNNFILKHSHNIYISAKKKEEYKAITKSKNINYKLHLPERMKLSTK